MKELSKKRNDVLWAINDEDGKYHRHFARRDTWIEEIKDKTTGKVILKKKSKLISKEEATKLLEAYNKEHNRKCVPYRW